MDKFSSAFAGYKKEEVNKFVNDVVNQVEAIIVDLKTKDARIEILEKENEHYKNMEATFNRALLVAEDASNQIKRVARDEGQNLINEAKKNASRIVNEALIQAEKTYMENERLKRNQVIFKRRMKALMESHMDLIDEMEHLEF